MKTRIMSAMRRHWPFLTFVPLLTVVMTWPTLVHVFDAGGFWLPSDDLDLGMKVWDAAHARLVLAGQADLYFTDQLFWPKGLSLAFHSFSLPHMLLMLGAQLLLPTTNAFNLCFMLIILLNAAACYIYMRYLFRDKWLAMFGSVIFGLSVFVMEHPVHPDLNIVAPIPLVMYCIQRAFDEWRPRWMIPAGILSGATAFVSLYIFACLALTVGIYMIFKLAGLWRTRAFWVGMLLLVALSASVSAFRLYPMMREAGAWDEALNKARGQEHPSDLLDLFVHKENIVTEGVLAALQTARPPVREDGYLGYVALFLAAFGLIRSGSRRDSLVWLVILLAFVALKLGSTLTINGQVYEAFPLPKRYLNSMVPTLFRAFWITAYFHVGILLPMAILAARGLSSALSLAPAKRRSLIVIVCLLLNLLETIEPPDSRAMPADWLNYNSWLHSEGQAQDIRLINLPFGRGPSKRYAFFHAISGYPHAEGLAARTPAAAYDYIRGNAILNAWNKGEGILCLAYNQGVFKLAIDQLAADGFTHIVVHGVHWGHYAFANFSLISLIPDYEDPYVKVYRLRNLPESCDHATFWRRDVMSRITSISLGNFRQAKIHGGPPYEGASLGGHSRDSIVEAAPSMLLPLTADGIAIGPSIPLLNDIQVDDPLPDKVIALLVYTPPPAAGEPIEAYAGRLLDGFQSCGRHQRSGAALEYFARAGIPCPLLFPAESLAVSYDNGMVLANGIPKIDGARLDIDLFWNKLPQDPHGLSIQVFNQGGDKVAGSDFVIHHDSYYRHSMDLSPLGPGVYDLKLILYNFRSGVSIAGAVASTRSRFERALEFGRIALD